MAPLGKHSLASAWGPKQKLALSGTPPHARARAKARASV